MVFTVWVKKCINYFGQVVATNPSLSLLEFLPESAAAELQVFLDEMGAHSVELQQSMDFLESVLVSPTDAESKRRNLLKVVGKNPASFVAAFWKTYDELPMASRPPLCWVQTLICWRLDELHFGHLATTLRKEFRGVEDGPSALKSVRTICHLNVGLTASIGNSQTPGDDPMIGSLGGFRSPPGRGFPFRPPQNRGGGFRPPFGSPPARAPTWGAPPGRGPPVPRGACYRCGQLHWAVGPNRTPCPSPPLAGSAVGSLESDTWRNLPSTQGGASSPPTGGGLQ